MKAVVYGFRSLRGQSYWVIATQIIVLTSVLLRGSSIWSFLDFLSRLQTRTASEQDFTAAQANLHFLQAGAPLFIFFDLLLLASFLIWVHHASENLSTLNAQDQKFSASASVGLFFVPIANFYFPGQVLQEIWRGSTPSGDLTDGYSWHRVDRRKRSLLVSLWWAVYLVRAISGIFLYLGTGSRSASPLYGRSPGSDNRALMEHFTQVNQSLLFSVSVNALYMVLLFALVTAITQRQERRYQRLAALTRGDASPLPRRKSLRLILAPALVAAFLANLETLAYVRREQAVRVQSPELHTSISHLTTNYKGGRFA